MAKSKNANLHNAKAAKNDEFYKTDYENLSFPLPPIEEQKRIVEKLDKILPLCEELEKEFA